MADENENGQERTEAPSARKEQQAREKGQVARSRELNTMVLLLAGSAAAWTMGPSMMHGLLRLMREHLHIERAVVFDPAAMVLQFRSGLLDALFTLTPFFVVAVIAALVAPMALGGWMFSAESLSFKWEKLDPVKGLGRVFALRGFVELVKALAKFLVVGSVAAVFLYQSVGALRGLGFEPLHAALGHTGYLVTKALVVFSSALIIIAAADVPFQLWDHGKQLRMTRQEVRDEHKESEGSPEAKGHMRRLQREMAQRRMMTEVPKADVVVTNPQHYAVALRYDQAKMRAPIVVAKGADLIAAHIRNIANGASVPVVSAPPLARALYHTTDLNKEIPAGLYLAVAQVLAYVLQLKRSVGRRRGYENLQMPDLPIPDDMQFD